MWKLSKTAHKAVTIISLLTEVLTNLLSDTKGASKALTYHSWLTVSHALSSGLLKHPSSVELLLEQKTHLHIMCFGPVGAGGPGSLNPVLNVHETYLPHHCLLICPPEAHQPPSLGQHLLICPQEVHLTPSSGSYACLHSSLACMPATLWHGCSTGTCSSVVGCALSPTLPKSRLGSPGWVLSPVGISQGIHDENRARSLLMGWKEDW